MSSVLQRFITNAINKATLTANSILYAVSAEVPAALSVAASRIVGRKASGDIAALTGAEVREIEGTAPFVLGSDADGDMYFRASSALARLAKGTANYKMFMNAAGTAPEWRKGGGLKTYTRDLSLDAGDVAYTAIGFKPMILIFFCNLGTTSVSIGASDKETLEFIHAHLSLPAFFASTSYPIFLSDAAGSHYQTAQVKSMDADGFTLTWSKHGTPTGTGNIFVYAIP